MSVTRRLACGFAIALSAISVFAVELLRAKPESVGPSSSCLAHINAVLHAKVDAGEIPCNVALVARHRTDASLTRFAHSA